MNEINWNWYEFSLDEILKNAVSMFFSQIPLLSSFREYMNNKAIQIFTWIGEEYAGIEITGLKKISV